MSEKSIALNIIQKKQQLNNPTLINRERLPYFIAYLCVYLSNTPTSPTAVAALLFISATGSNLK